VHPGVDPNAIISWSFDWGKWLVNTTDRDLSISLADRQRLLQATPGQDATLQVELDYPLGGHWDLTPCPALLSVPAHSYLVVVSSRAREEGEAAVTRKN
jgi:hypothetical protein